MSDDANQPPGLRAILDRWFGDDYEAGNKKARIEADLMALIKCYGAEVRLADWHICCVPCAREIAAADLPLVPR